MYYTPTMRIVIAALVALLLSPSLAAAKKPKERYHLRIDQVRSVDGVPDEVAETAKAMLETIISKRPDFVMTLEGAPDPATDAPAFAAWLKKNRIKAFSVELKLTTYSKTVTPAPEGKKGQVLTVTVAVEILGSSLPDMSWAMTGDGSAMIATEVGSKVSAAIEKNVTKEVLTSALTIAVDRALHKLQTQKPPKPQKK